MFSFSQHGTVCFIGFMDGIYNAPDMVNVVQPTYSKLSNSISLNWCTHVETRIKVKLHANNSKVDTLIVD